MRIALIGATGNVGSRILDEALRSGHNVTAIVRDPMKLSPRPQLNIQQGDANNTDKLAAAIKGCDVAVSSYTPARGTPNYDQTAKAGYRSIAAAAKKAGVRLIAVG